MQQGFLFNMPSREPESKIGNKNLLSKVNTTVEKRAVTLNAANSIHATIETAKLLLKPDKRLQLITDDKEFGAYIDRATKFGRVALDTEATGKIPILDTLVGASFYFPGEDRDEKAIYTPVAHRSYMTMEVKEGQLSKEALITGLKVLVACGTELIFHNAKFDIELIYWNYGIKMRAWWDTLLASNCLNENEPHGLKPLYSKYIERSVDEAKTYSELFDGIDFSLVPFNLGYIYAAKDAYMTYGLYEFQAKHLNADKLPGCYNVFRNIEMRVLPHVIDMELTGVCIDVEFAQKLDDKYSDLYAKAKENVFNELSKYDSEISKFRRRHPDKASKLSDPINLSSPTQMAIIFYDVLGMKSSDKKKPRGTGKDILKSFNNPLADAILEYRGYEKLLSTYIEKLPGEVRARTGRLHGSFNQYGAKTGRFSSQDPNLQNIPSHNHEIRQMFTAPEGYVFIGGDYSQQEPRCLTFVSGDPAMLDAYKSGRDIYATIASKIYRVPYEDCLEFNPDGSTNEEGKTRRGNTKSIVLGMMYGRQAPSIAEQTGMTTPEAQGLIDDFFDAFPRIKKFVDTSIAKAKKHGFVETVWGRKRRLPDIQLSPYEFRDMKGKPVAQNIINNYMRQIDNAGSRQTKTIIDNAFKVGIVIKDNTYTIAEAERQVVNSIIQGSSADMTKLAISLIGENERLKELKYQTVLTIHDEVIGIVPIENAKEAMEIVQKCMIDAPKGVVEVPMKCDMAAYEKWYGEELDIA